MDLGEGTIIQINATIIAGILILLTISGIDPQSQTKSTFLDQVGGIYDATAIVIFPFAISAIIAVIAAYFHESFAETIRFKELRENKIQKLKDLSISLDDKSRRKIEKEIENLEEKLTRVNKYLRTFDEERCYTYFINARLTSLIVLMAGFAYLIVVIYGIAWN